MENIPTREEVTKVLFSIWETAVMLEEYDEVFEYTGEDSQFNNGYDEVYEERLRQQRIIALGETNA
jgi:hypothetical protein